MTQLRYVLIAISGLAALGIALWLRYGIVEVEGMGVTCSQQLAGHLEGPCVFRQWVIELFKGNRLGYVALGAALLSLLPRLNPLAWLGWCAGIAGLILYCVDASAPAVLLALLVLSKAVRAIPAHNRAQA